MTRQREVEPVDALVGALAALAEAARYTGGGVRTAGVRAGRAGTRLGRRAWDNTLDSGRRANLAYHVYRGDEQVHRRKPSEYVTVGVVAGVAGTFAVVALARALLRRPDEGIRTTGEKPRMEAAREAVGRVLPRRTPTPADSPVPGGTTATTA